ncbi:hypothetical protein KCP73_21435 [Salmonella enterica subsp. enterica]|nr:hypothetical protein KCP73_21435 [Salmonella enterica subsp. enterica]
MVGWWRRAPALYSQRGRSVIGVRSACLAGIYLPHGFLSVTTMSAPSLQSGGRRAVDCDVG